MIHYGGKTTKVPVLRGEFNATQGLASHKGHGRSADLPLQELRPEVHAQEPTDWRSGRNARAIASAAHGWLGQAGEKPKWENVVADFTAPIPNSEIRPNPKAAKVYDQLIEKYARCEREALKKIGEAV